MSQLRPHAAATALLAALTVFLTFPLAFRMSDHVRDAGDPLLNTWILAWDVEQLVNGNVRHFFDANIFFPHRRTLAYSENLLPQSLVAAGPLLASGNPILAYNVVFLLAFFSSALGAYALAYRLTGSATAGVIAGVIYGFSPFMFDHLSHLQILSAGGIPLTYFFLVRFFAGERWRDGVLAAVCFAVQILANGYYALYLTLFVSLTVLYHAVAGRRVLDRSFLLKLAVMAAIVVALAGPIFYQYVLFRNEVGLSREDEFPARLTSYVTVPDTNFLYGRFGLGEGLPEARLFPGLVPALLAGVGIAALFRRRCLAGGKVWRVRVPLRAAFAAASALLVLIMAVVLIRGRFSWEISASSLSRPFFLVVILASLLAAVDRGFRRALLRPLDSGPAWLQLFGMTMLLSVVLSFGTQGPFGLLRAYVPGFDALRAVARVHVLTMLALAVAAAFGTRRIFQRVGGGKKRLVAAVAGVLVVAEYISIPLPLEKISVGDEVPAVYRWLAQQEGRGPVLELPLRLHYRPGCERVYFSTYHWKPIVNGFSGYIPPLFGELQRRWLAEPPARVVDDAVALGVRYLVAHRDQMSQEEAEGLQAALEGRGEGARFAAAFAGTDVWELAAEEGVPIQGWTTLPRGRWRVESSEPQPAALAIDGDLSTRWHSNGPQRPGVWFEVDLGEVQRVSGVSLALAASPSDYPRGYEVLLSPDGGSWTPVRRDVMDHLPILAFLDPRRLAVDVRFPPAAARFVRIVGTRADPVFFWSIYEVGIHP